MRQLGIVDPELGALLDREAARQELTLELIASESFVPPAILEVQGSLLTNKYAEGYPGQRYHGGCQFIDAIEQCLGKPAIRNYMDMQPGDVPATWADATLLQRLTGYRPQTDVRDGIARFVEWYRDWSGK